MKSTGVVRKLAPADVPTLYRSMEVVAMTGATLRQLQWWDERRVLRPDNRRDHSSFYKTGHARLYTEEQVRIIDWVVLLRQNWSGQMKKTVALAKRLDKLGIDKQIVKKLLDAMRQTKLRLPL